MLNHNLKQIILPRFFTQQRSLKDFHRILTNSLLLNLRKNMSNSSRCAACKCLRRKCDQDCVLGPYFPSNNLQRFSHVHKVFGASTVTKMLQQLPEQLREKAADCMAYEASSRVNDPVYGCAGTVYRLQQQIIDSQKELLKINGEIAFHKTQHQLQLLSQETGSNGHVSDLGNLFYCITSSTSQ